jgi:hypothetical protein
MIKKISQIVVGDVREKPFKKCPFQNGLKLMSSV